MKTGDTLCAITTYGSAPYVDLSLTYMKRYTDQLVVYDDGSGSDKLREVCDKHKVLLFSRVAPHDTKPAAADMRDTVDLIRLSNAFGYSKCLKISRRWICKENPLPSLSELHEKSGGATFSNVTTSFNFGFRTEFVGFDVKSWIPVCTEFENIVRDNSAPFAEGEVHKLARKVEPKTAQYIEYIKNHPYPKDKDGYVHWEWMGTDRRNVPPYILWHDQHGPADYYNEARKLGLKWSLNDFIRVNG